MAVRSTSYEAYYDIKKKLGDRQRTVLQCLQSRSMTNRQLSKALGWEINRITGRVKELRDAGVIEDKGKVVCPYTGKKVHQWGIKELPERRGA